MDARLLKQQPQSSEVACGLPAILREEMAIEVDHGRSRNGGIVELPLVESLDTSIPCEKVGKSATVLIKVMDCSTLVREVRSNLALKSVRH